jgi:hypothetical protein
MSQHACKTDKILASFGAFGAFTGLLVTSVILIDLWENKRSPGNQKSNFAGWAIEPFTCNRFHFGHAGIAFNGVQLDR